MGRKHRSSSFGGSNLPPTPTPAASPPSDLTPCHTLVNHFVHGKNADGRTVFHRAIEAASSSSFAGSPAPHTYTSVQDVNTDKLDGLFFMDALSTRMKELDALSSGPRGNNTGGNKQNNCNNNSHFSRMVRTADTESGYNSLHYAILRRDLMTLLVLLKHASSSLDEDNGSMSTQMPHPLRLLDGNCTGGDSELMNELASRRDREHLTPLQLLGRTSSNGLERCRRTLQWKSLHKVWKRNSCQIQGNESVGQRHNEGNEGNNQHRYRRRRMISFGNDRDYEIDEDPDRAALVARESTARSGSFNVDLNNGHRGEDENEQVDGRNNDLMPLEDADFGELAVGDDNSDGVAAASNEQRPILAASIHANAADDYGCEVLTFGRADHCALGVPQFTTSARTRERGEDNFSSLSNTTSYKPKRVETFALGELRRRWSSSNANHNSINSAACGEKERETVDSPAVAIAASTHHTLVSTQSGQLFSFGLGKGGRLGTGDENHRPLPTRVLGPLTKRIVASIAAAENHSLCSTSDGDVYAWGSNGFGQLGILSSSREQQHGQGANINNSRLSPRRVEGELKQSFVVAVAAGDRHSVALTRLGEVYCWGDNRSGQLAMFNSSVGSSAPLSPSQLNGRCSHRPQRVEGLWSAQPRRRAIAIAAAEFSTLVLTMPPTVNSGESSIALLPVNTIYGWGHGNHSPMRVALPDNMSTPSSVQNSRSTLYARSVCINPIAIAQAKYHSVAITACGCVYTWGLHSESLGIEKSPGGRTRKNSADVWATSENKRPANHQSSVISSPQLVVDMLPENGGGQAVAVSASESHSAVVTSDGHLYTFGSSHGNGVLGHKGVRWQPNPRKVKRVHRAVCVSAAKEHTVILMGTHFPKLERHQSAELAVDGYGYHQPLTLQDSASIEISRNVDMFNVISIALFAYRLNCRPLINFCEEFVSKNLDGVLAVGIKNDFSTFLTSRALVGVTRNNECDGLFHPLLYRLANSKTWMEEGTMLFEEYSGSEALKKAKRTKRAERSAGICKAISSAKTAKKQIVADEETLREQKCETSDAEEMEEQVQVPKKLFHEKPKGKPSGNASKFHCAACGVSCPDNDSYTLHVNGRRHRNHLMHVKAEEERAVVENIHSMKRMTLMEDSLRYQQIHEKTTAGKQRGAWGAPKVATTSIATPSSGQRTRSTSFHDILNEEQKRLSTHPGITHGMLLTPASAKKMSPADIFPAKSPSVAYAKKSSHIQSPGPTLTLSAFMAKKNEPKQDPMGSVGASWGAKPVKTNGASWSAKATSKALPKQHQALLKMKSFSEIQQEEEAMRSNEDHMCHIKGDWFVQQRERAAGLRDIQQKEKEESEMQDLIKEQKQIEIEIMKQLKQENDVKKKGRRNRKPKDKPDNCNSKQKTPQNGKPGNANSKKKNTQNGMPKKKRAHQQKQE